MERGKDDPGKTRDSRSSEKQHTKEGQNIRKVLKQQVEILKKSDADAVISIGAYAACAAFIRDARDAGWNVPIANVSFVGSEFLNRTSY